MVGLYYVGNALAFAVLTAFLFFIPVLIVWRPGEQGVPLSVALGAGFAFGLAPARKWHKRGNMFHSRACPSPPDAQ